MKVITGAVYDTPNTYAVRYGIYNRTIIFNEFQGRDYFKDLAPKKVARLVDEYDCALYIAPAAECYGYRPFMDFLIGECGASLIELGINPRTNNMISACALFKDTFNTPLDTLSDTKYPYYSCCWFNSYRFPIIVKDSSDKWTVKVKEYDTLPPFPFKEAPNE